MIKIVWDWSLLVWSCKSTVSILFKDQKLKEFISLNFKAYLGILHEMLYNIYNTSMKPKRIKYQISS